MDMGLLSRLSTHFKLVLGNSVAHQAGQDFPPRKFGRARAEAQRTARIFASIAKAFGQ